MYEGAPRSRAELEYRRRQAQRPVNRRPDRIALWAVGLAVIAMIAAATSAHAGSGGTGTTTGSGGTGTSSGCPDTRFGSRSLSLGDCGTDVKTLHWILKAKSYGVPLDKEFDDPTDGSVRTFQKR